MYRLRSIIFLVSVAAAVGACNRNSSPVVPETAHTEGSGVGEEGSAEAASAEGSAEAVVPDGPCAGQHPDAVALVDCTPVMSAAELQAELDEMVERYERLPGRDATDAAWRNERRRRLVRSAVQVAILDQHVTAAGVVVSDEDVTTAIRDDLAHVFEDERLFERFLESHGTTREEYLDEVRHEIAIDRVLAERGQLDPTQEDIQNFYDQNRERWREGERVLASNITIRLRSSATEEQVAEARGRIDAIRERIVEGGEDFATVAGTESESADRVRGGDRGWIVRGRRQQLVEDGVEDVLFDARPGTVTEPLRTQLGWQIFLVVDQRPEGFRDLDEVQQILQEPLRRRNRDRLSRELEDQLIETIEVLYLEENWGLEEEVPAEAVNVAAGAADGSGE